MDSSGGVGKTGKRVFVLVGPKGAGKTYLGTRLQAELGVPFLRVEDIWLALRREGAFTAERFDAEGQRRVLAAIAGHLTAVDNVTIESTGTAPWLGAFLDRLGAMAEVVLIRLAVPLPLCLQRTRERDASLHIPISDERIEAINVIADKVVLDWAVETSNASRADADRFLAAFKARFLS